MPSIFTIPLIVLGVLVKITMSLDWLETDSMYSYTAVILIEQSNVYSCVPILLTLSCMLTLKIGMLEEIII